MKASEMTNEELAKALMSRVPLDSNNHDDIREASARLRKQDIIVAAQKAKGAAAKREMADEKRISDAVIQSLRDKKLEKDREVAEKDNEIARLRELVSELLNKLVINHCIGCQVDDCDGCVYYAQNEALVARAREVIGGAK